ncbi:MAG TPA: hypothetical protein PK295_04650 [Candidatus Magasanikbacteria bacterium]|nr:hypothetical protein [Candidatus Magasanikbacteria bacterium]
MKSHSHHHGENTPSKGDIEQKPTFSPIIVPEEKVLNEHEDLKTLIEKNIKWSQVIYHQNRKIQRRLSWIVFGSYFKLFLILVPIIIGLIYLPPLVSDFMKQYGSVFGDQSTWKQYFDAFTAS